jgi:iron complex outermembrane receptor protein
MMSERGNLALARAMARAHGRSAGSHASSLAIALALAISGGAPALAQTQPQSTPAQTTPAQPTQTQDSGPADIVVTAFKRAETSLKVPAAIAVLGGNDLRTVGVNSVNDVQNLGARRGHRQWVFRHQRDHSG